jgi:hypothetical protein
MQQMNGVTGLVMSWIWDIVTIGWILDNEFVIPKILLGLTPLIGDRRDTVSPLLQTNKFVIPEKVLSRVYLLCQLWIVNYWVKS